jgi:hypothetical protein
MAEKAEIMGEAVGKECAETVVVAAGLSAAWLKPAFLVARYLMQQAVSETT